jgi:hypothetical protein
MTKKPLAILAVYCLLLTVIGCKPQRILVQPGLGAYQFVRVGDDLEFSAFFPSNKPMYVIFSGYGPCGPDVTYVTIPPGKQGSCKVTSEANTYYFYPSFTPAPPTPPGQHFIGPFQIPQGCPQCQEIIVAPKDDSTDTQSDQSQTSTGTALGTATPITVTCVDGKTAVAELDYLIPNQQVFWFFSPDRGAGLTITLPQGVCQKTTFQQREACTLQPQQSYPNKVTYSVQADKCATSASGNGILTINAPTQPQPPQ